ncbi:DUF1294 domain-containing protein [Flavobacterium sp.]|uniref:DUF1294 domain-containing protein n=1 Tax=Flavobacterium sp. TaxID=239 RepID=UPI0037897C33
MNLLLYYFFILNAIGFLLTTYDKHLAKARKHRIPERTLLGFVFLGGTIGSGLAMLIFRHKTSKTSYLWRFWGIVIIQCLIAFLWFYSSK